MVISTYLRAAAAVALAIQQGVFAQQCYYPNGVEADQAEKPCSSAEGSACCPDKWQCMENGLCYYEPDKLYGRYSCTDKDWNSPGCPSNLCTYDMSASGAEAITQCSDHDNQWCCDANRVDVECCKESPKPRPFFALQDPVAYGTAGGNIGSSAPNLASITGKALGGGSDSASSTAPPSTSATKSSDSSTSDSDSSASPTSTGPSTPVTSVQTSVSSGTAGVSTLIITTILQPAASSTNGAAPTPSSGKKSKLPVIVGCAVGIPLALALLGILIWLFRKRAHQKRVPPYSETPDPYANGTATPEFTGGAKFHKNGVTKLESTDPGVPELGGGQGVGPERPISMIPGKAEMDSGAGFLPGTTPQAPHLVGVGGGNGHHTPQSSWGSAPPGYSPGQNQNAWAPGHAQHPSADGAVGAAAAAAASQQTSGGRYIPYRPPPNHPAALNNLPEMAELPTVQTPPEVAEMGNGPSPPAVAELGNPSPPARAEYPGMAELGPQRSRPN
ncbi:hypothetical protein N0V90_009184 [Kalmusia sp. IMI 367209]|nr:hypothetical protein N0V90_009184 [Kalmusia sp. IMI 367209]